MRRRVPYIKDYDSVVVVVVGRAHLSGRALSLFFRWLSFFLAILNGRVVSVFFPKTTTTAAILNGRVVSVFFPQDNNNMYLYQPVKQSRNNHVAAV